VLSLAVLAQQLQLLHTAMHAANTSLQKLAVGSMSLCKMANAESCLMKNKVLVRFYICNLPADEEQQNITRCVRINYMKENLK